MNENVNGDGHKAVERVSIPKHLYDALVAWQRWDYDAGRHLQDALDKCGKDFGLLQSRGEGQGVDGEAITCPHCKGSGTTSIWTSSGANPVVDLECRDCGGTGKIPAGGYPASAGRGLETASGRPGATPPTNASRDNARTSSSPVTEAGLAGLEEIEKFVAHVTTTDSLGTVCLVCRGADCIAQDFLRMVKSLRPSSPETPTRDELAHLISAFIQQWHEMPELRTRPVFYGFLADKLFDALCTRLSSRERS